MEMRSDELCQLLWLCVESSSIADLHVAIWDTAPSESKAFSAVAEPRLMRESSIATDALKTTEFTGIIHLLLT